MSEAMLQTAVANFLNQLETEGKLVWHHPPNEGRRHNGRRLVAQGMKAGVPDVCIVLHGGQSVFIELKYKGNYLSPRQREVHDKLNALHAPVYTVTAESHYVAVQKVREILRDMGVNT